MSRVGLLFTTGSPARGAVRGVTELLDAIARKSAGPPEHQPFVVFPFVRSGPMAVFAQEAAHGYAVEAASFDQAGVTFGDLAMLTHVEHPSYDARFEFDLGVKVLLPRCDVVLVVCADAIELADAKARLHSLSNVAALFALIALDTAATEFLTIDPFFSPIDETGWLLGIAERWSRTRDAAPPAEQSTWLGLLFPYLSSLLIGRRTETVKPKESSAIDRCRAGMGFSVVASQKLEAADTQTVAAIVTALCPFFNGHDALGRHYANVFRTMCLVVPVLIATSTVLAAAAALNEERAGLWHWSEAALLVLAAALYLRSTKVDYHRRWVEHRLRTELIRPTLLHALFHTGPSLTPPTEEPSIWIEQSRVVLGVLRALPITRLVTPRKDLLSARKSAIGDFAAYQARWHRDFAEQHRTAEKRMAGWSARAFFVTLCFCALQLAAPLVLEPSLRVRHAATLLTLVIAMSAFLVLLLVHQLGFAAIAERSANAAEHFAGLADTIEREMVGADARRAYEWADQCANAILSEQISWYRQIPLIRFHL